jgi:hypothetical protein
MVAVDRGELDQLLVAAHLEKALRQMAGALGAALPRLRRLRTPGRRR